MRIDGGVFLVTGGASGLGEAAARELIAEGGRVVIADLPTSSGRTLSDELGESAHFVEADVTVVEQVRDAVASAVKIGPLRGVVHTAGRGGAIRVVDRDGNPGDSEFFGEVLRVNLLGSFIVLSQAASAMAQNEPIDGDRGTVVLTASAAAFEGQVGQASYAASKAGVVGLTLTAARDLAQRSVRVCTIAPGLMDTPMLGRLREDVRTSLAQSVPHPHRLGQPEEFGRLAVQILSNGYLNGETIRLDGAIRMAPR
jgi:NAD(P)-dependent dehydrogenase (short-subunit alcohol dehydrogenase family)